MTTWKTCPVCGKELPSTMYSIDLATGARREVCKACFKKLPPERRTAPGLSTHPGTFGHWTEADDEVIRAHVGERTEDVAELIGRTRMSVTVHVRNMAGLRCVDGWILED